MSEHGIYCNLIMRGGNFKRSPVQALESHGKAEL